MFLKFMLQTSIELLVLNKALGVSLPAKHVLAGLSVLQQLLHWRQLENMVIDCYQSNQRELHCTIRWLT